MLLWGLAAAAPILIHLWNRRRHRDTDWAAMRFLLAAMKKNRRRIQVEQLLLLIVRCAIMLFFAIALADLSCVASPGLAGFSAAGARTHHVLVFDNSYSMAYGADGETRLAQAKRLARRIIEDAAEGDGFSLVGMGPTSQGIISDPAFDPKDVLREIDQITVDAGVANLDLALAEIQTTLENGSRDFSRLKRAKVAIFTDYGANTWQQADSPSNHSTIESIASSAIVQCYDVGQLETANSAIVSVEQVSSYLVPGALARYRIDVSCDNPVQIPDQVLQMLVDGQLVSQQIIRFNDSNLASAELSTTFEKPGNHSIEFRLNDDALSVDNQFYFVAHVKSNVRVLVLADESSQSQFVTIALDPTAGAGNGPVEVVTTRFSSLLDLDLISFDVIYLSNVARFNLEEATLLKSYVQQGKSLVIFLGDRVDSANYNQQFAAGSNSQAMLPVRLDAPSQRGDYILDPRGYQHPMLQPFRGQQAGGLLTTPIWNYYRVQPIEGVAAENVLWFGNGDPAVVSLQTFISGRDDEAPGRLGGRVTLFSLPASTDSVDRTLEPPAAWTVFPTWPSFPPMVQESLAYSLASQVNRRNIRPGELFEGVLKLESAGQTVEVSTPQQRKIRVQSEARDDRLYWVFGETRQPGIYKITTGNLSSSQVAFSVNADTAESDLSRIGLESLPESLKPGENQLDNPGSVRISASASIELFRYFLVVVLALLFLESFLAYHFGAAKR